MTGIYSAAAGMAAQQTWLDALANDLANVNTPGYRSERVAFRDLVYDPDGGGAGAAAAPLGTSSQAGGISPDADPLSLAIEGDGYFQVRQPDGTVALTRDGAFQLDASGQVVNAAGDRLVPPITLPKGVTPNDLTITADGTVKTGGGTTLGKIELVDVPSSGGLAQLGSSLLGVTAASGAPVKASGKIQQRALEASDVDLAAAMTDLIQAQRAYALDSRAITTQDQMLQIANQLRS